MGVVTDRNNEEEDVIVEAVPAIVVPEEPLSSAVVAAAVQPLILQSSSSLLSASSPPSSSHHQQLQQHSLMLPPILPPPPLNNNNQQLHPMPLSPASADNTHQQYHTLQQQQQQQQQQFNSHNQHNGNNNNNNNNNINNPHIRRRFLSRHREDLEHLETDAAHNVMHPIPEPSAFNNNNNSREASAEEASQQQQQQPAPSQDRWDRIQTTMANFTQLPHTPQEWLTFLLPAWRWLKLYNVTESFGSDLLAGLAVGVMVIPQGMSYAKLAGLPVEYGWYSALLPVYAYSLFGSSRELAVGPVALVSLLLHVGIANVLGWNPEESNNEQDQEQYTKEFTSMAIQISFLVGTINIALGLARLGFITIFLSHAVVSGFTTGAAVIIGLNQLSAIFGYYIPWSDRIYTLLGNWLKNLGDTNWKTFVMGILSIAMLLALKHIGKTNKKLRWVQAIGPLTVTLIGVLLVYTLDLQDNGIPIVGNIPQGFPSFSVDVWVPMDHMQKLWFPVLSITLFGFMESISIAKRLAATHKYEIDNSLELIGLGVANFAGAMFQAYPVTGSYSRSTINNDCGAQSGVAGMVTATLVVVVLIFLTRVFELVPNCTLAAIVVSGVFGLVDYEEAMHLWKVHKKDFTIWTCACVGTMFLGVQIGLILSVGVSLIIVLYESAYPHTAVLGRLPGTTVYRNVKQYPEAEEYIGIVIIRVDAPLYFANAQNVRDKVRKYRLAAEEDTAYRNGDVKYMIIDLTPVSHVDTTALHVLEDMHANYQSRNQQLCFCNPSLIVKKRFDDSGFTEKVGRQFFFSCAHDAVKWCLAEMDLEATSAHETQIQTSDGSMNSRTNCNDDLGCPVRVTRLAPLEVVFDA
jgi:sulfate transporter 4